MDSSDASHDRCLFSKHIRTIGAYLPGEVLQGRYAFLRLSKLLW